MTFWILLTAMTVLVVIAILIPLFRKRENVVFDGNDEEVFRQQLAEINRDLERGDIQSDIAEAAKVEVSRRLLEAHRKNKEALQASNSSLRTRLMFGAVVILMPVVAVYGYDRLGAAGMLDAPLAQRLVQQSGQENIEMLVARTERHLQQNPDDGNDWAVLAPVYMRMGRFQEAANAYAKARRTLKEHPDLMLGHAEAMVFAENGLVNDEARALFKTLSVQFPEQIKPRFYLALGLGQTGAKDEAIAAWDALLEGADPNAPWVQAALTEKQALVDGTYQIPSSQSTLAEEATGPTAEDVQAASELSEQDRSQMINDMVASLSDRLKEEGGSLKEWAQLIRSQIVLGKKDDAEKSVELARANLAQDQAAMSQLDQLVSQLGL